MSKSMSSGLNEFKVIFRGVRGSYPISSPDTLKYGGHTPCIEVRVNGYLIIIDAGTGIIELGNDLIKEQIASGSSEKNRKPINTVVLFSHTHNDHLQGFPFFKPAYISTSKIHMYGARSMGVNFKEVLSQSMFTHFSPVDLAEIAAKIHINNIKETDIITLYPNNPEPEILRINPYDDSDIPEDTVIISCLKSFAHPKDGVLIYKISWKNHSVVYATDTEGYVGGDSKLAAFARNTDLLIHDAQYILEDYTSIISPKQGFGHSTYEMAVESAKLANAKQLVLFHHDPTYDDELIDNIEENAKKLFKNTLAAYERLEIKLI